MRGIVAAIGPCDVDWVAAPAAERARVVAALQQVRARLLAGAATGQPSPVSPTPHPLGWTVMKAARADMRVRPWVEQLGERVSLAAATVPPAGGARRPVSGLSVAQRNLRMVVANLVAGEGAGTAIRQFLEQPAAQLGLTLALYCELRGEQSLPAWLGCFKPATLLAAGQFMSKLGEQAPPLDMLRQGIDRHV